MYVIMYKLCSKSHYNNFHLFCLPVVATNEGSLCKIKNKEVFFFFIAALSHFTFGQETFRINLKLIFCSFSLLFEPCGDRNNETWAERKVAVFRKCNGIFKPMG